MPSLGDLVSISGGWMLLCMEFTMADDSPHNCAVQTSILM